MWDKSEVEGPRSRSHPLVPIVRAAEMPSLISCCPLTFHCLPGAGPNWEPRIPGHQKARKPVRQKTKRAQKEGIRQRRHN